MFLVICFSQHFRGNLRVVAIVEMILKLRIQQTSIYIRVILNEKNTHENQMFANDSSNGFRMLFFQIGLIHLSFTVSQLILICH